MGHFRQTIHVVQRNGETLAVARPQDQVKATISLSRLASGPPEAFNEGFVAMLFEQPYKLLGLYAEAPTSRHRFIVDPTTRTVLDVVKNGDAYISYEKFLDGRYGEMTWL